MKPGASFTLSVMIAPKRDAVWPAGTVILKKRRSKLSQLGWDGSFGFTSIKKGSSNVPKSICAVPLTVLEAAVRVVESVTSVEVSGAKSARHFVSRGYRT